jgi:hypothetical protein
MASAIESVVKRINLRLILFTGTLLLLIGWPIYTFLAETLTHGIHDRGSYKEVDLKAMGFFQFNPRRATLNDVPAVYRGLDGKKVLLTGLVKPLDQAGANISGFTLLYSETCQCGFGGAPQVQEKVFATAVPGTKLRYEGSGYHEVFGTLHVTMKKDQETGEVVEVYHLDVESIKPIQ